MTVILEGIVGSTAYGLAGPNSDEDRLGIFVASRRDVLGLQGPQKVQESRVTHEPDKTYHELGKYVSLALKANPTVLELMYLPVYEVCDGYGDWLLENRSAFLSTKAVRDAYGGYAYQQATRLLKRHDAGEEGFSSDIKNRTAKHGRHCARLLLQGTQLLQTGEIVVDVSEYRDELFSVGDLAVLEPEKFYKYFEYKREFMDEVQSVLPDQPDWNAANEFVIGVREDLG